MFHYQKQSHYGFNTIMSRKPYIPTDSSAEILFHCCKRRNDIQYDNINKKFYKILLHMYLHTMQIKNFLLNHTSRYKYGWHFHVSSKIKVLFPKILPCPTYLLNCRWHRIQGIVVTWFEKISIAIRNCLWALLEYLAFANRKNNMRILFLFELYF